MISPTTLTSVWVQEGVCVLCVFNDVTGENIAQTDNESYESTTTGHYSGIKPNAPFFWVILSVMYVCTYIC